MNTVQSDGQNLDTIQAQWDKRHALVRAKMAGTTQKGLAVTFRCTQQRVSQLCKKAKKEISDNRSSPLQIYLSRPAIVSLEGAETFLKSCERSAEIARRIR